MYQRITVQIESNYEHAKIDSAWIATALNEHVSKGNGNEVFVVTEIKPNPDRDTCPDNSLTKPFND